MSAPAAYPGEGPVIELGPVRCGAGEPLVLIAGPCVVESRDHTLKVAEAVRAAASRHGVSLIFKASYDKANRTSGTSYRGPGQDEGLRVLAEVKESLGLPIVTDVHLPEQCAAAAEVADVLQIPAFLSRQTDLLEAAAKTGRAMNIKKGQFLAPDDMRHVVQKARAAGAQHLMVTERGASFGYHDLVVDMRGLVAMREAGVPICFDATHSVQRPSGAGGTTGGDRTLAPVLARAAVAVGVDAVFAEVHDNPDAALSDGPNSLTFELLDQLLTETTAVRRALGGA